MKCRMETVRTAILYICGFSFLIVCMFQLSSAAAPVEKEEETFSNGTFPANVTSDEEVFEAEVNCSDVSAFVPFMFAEQNNDSAVYLTTANMKPSAFTQVDFTKYISVFGFRLIATSNVSDDDMVHYAKIFAKYIDNDEDGIPDRNDAVDAMKNFTAMIAIFYDSSESENFWMNVFPQPESDDFRTLFFCQIHFFEQWLSDRNVNFHKLRNKALLSSLPLDLTSKTCDDIKQTSFDWPIWYFIFTIAYYGYLEVFDDKTINTMKNTLHTAKQAVKFNGNYPDDPEMELADFLSWSIVTKLGALNCHCDAEVIDEVWKICTPNDLKNFDKNYFHFLETIQGLPTTLPNGEYNSLAVLA